jgi:uncharacterized protein (TIGR03067 family)
MWRSVAIMAGALLTVPLIAGGPGTDLKKLQGTWQGTTLEIGGKAPSEAEKKLRVKFVITGEKYTVFFNEMKINDGTLKLDETKKPKTLDVTPGDGEFKGKVQPAIYQLDGDELKVVFTEPGKERPNEFKTREKTEEVMISYRRVKGK